MVDLLRYYDLVIGSRFVMRGGMEDRLRYHFSQLYNVFIRALFQTQIQDNLSGYFAIRRERLYALAPLFPAIFYGYGDYFIRLLLAAWRQDWKILEVPVFYILRRHGDSKTGFWSIFQQYTKAVLRLRLRAARLNETRQGRGCNVSGSTARLSSPRSELAEVSVERARSVTHLALSNVTRLWVESTSCNEFAFLAC
jgi:hypothetical protein